MPRLVASEDKLPRIITSRENMNSMLGLIKSEDNLRGLMGQPKFYARTNYIEGKSVFLPM